VIVSGSEPAWVEGSFLALKDRIDKVRPQKSWVRSHPTLLLNLIALGIGSLAVWTIDLVLDLTLTKLKVDEFMPRLPADSPWRRVLSSAEPLLYVLGWIWRWFLGLMWGAHSVRQWLLAMWPSIEFDFGLPTLQTEKIQRRRLYAVYLLVIVPTVTKLLYDLLKRAF